MAPSKNHADQNQKILSYNDVVLRRSDIDILAGPHYINDRLIEFYFAHLSATSPSSAAVLLVPPSLSFWIANCPDPDSNREILAPLHLRDRDLVLLTVNNNADVSLAEGGSHWSLLVYEGRADEFLHHDSCGGMNRRSAEQLYGAVRGFVGSGRARFVEASTPQQRNGYDCGLHVMAAARAVFSWHENGSLNELERWLPDLRGEAARVPDLRDELLRLITDLMEQQRRDLMEQQRSTDAKKK